MSGNAGGRPSSSGPRNSEVERIIASAEVDTTFAGKKARYRGRRSTWPGALGLLLLAAGSIAGLTYYGIKLHQDVQDRNKSNDVAVRGRFGSGTRIVDGRPVVEVEDIEVTNPESYKDKKCEQPNYVSKDGKLVAIYKSGKEVPLVIKGVNWFGMQDNKGVPKGLWDNSREGSTLYRIGEFLKGNNFNVVRLPLAVDSVMRNVEPQENLINTNSNRALETSRYLKLLGSIIQGLGQHNIGVVLDFHVLSAFEKEDSSGLWYGTSIQLPDIKTAIDNLAKDLCNGKHFNVIGIDLKDGIGNKATWGDKTDTDWAAAATELAEHLVSKCDKWVAFVQGIQGGSRKDTYQPGERTIKNKYWPGADLTGVAKSPIQLSTAGKVVYAPPFYTNTKLPQSYFFDDGERAGDMLKDYKESDDKTLSANVQAAMDYMFGPALESGAAVVLSSYGGLVGDKDETKKKTSTRIVSILIDKMKTQKKALAGGFWNALNPDTIWLYPAPDNGNATTAGLVDETWRAANMDVLSSLKRLDTLDIQFLPCESTEA